MVFAHDGRCYPCSAKNDSKRYFAMSNNARINGKYQA